MEIKTLNNLEGIKFEGLFLITPNKFNDERGSFYESWNKKVFDKAIKSKVNFVQDNHSSSSKGVLRGLHYQINPSPQGKLVRCIFGEIFDVAVDIRVGSPSFGQWVGQVLDDRSHRQLWIPPGFAHGFQSLKGTTVVQYKCTENFWSPKHEQTIKYNDPFIGINWPLEVAAVHDRDRGAPNLKTLNILPIYNEKLFNA